PDGENGPEWKGKELQRHPPTEEGADAVRAAEGDEEPGDGRHEEPRRVDDDRRPLEGFGRQGPEVVLEPNAGEPAESGFLPTSAVSRHAEVVHELAEQAV